MFIFGIFITIVGVIAFFAFKKRERRVEANASLAVFAVGIIISVLQTITIIPAGTVGVIDIFGKVSEITLKPGINFVNPFARVIEYSYKTQEFKETMKTPSEEGLTVELEVSLLFRINPDWANRIYKEVLGDYREVILKPNFRSVVRGVTARYQAKALYTASREQLANEIMKELNTLVAERGIVIEAAPLRQITLPQGLISAIEEKLKAEQESQRMAFILDKERQEAERKTIEAKGISDFQTIVSEGINEQLLKWKGIEATEKLAASPNSKIIVIGSGKDGLPIILGGDK